MWEENYVFNAYGDHAKNSTTGKTAVAYAVVVEKFPMNYDPSNDGWKDVDEFLLAGLASYAAHNQGLLLSHEWIQNGFHRGVQGRTIWEGIAYEEKRKFWANGNLYNISVMVPEGAVLPMEAVEFLDSFKILD